MTPLPGVVITTRTDPDNSYVVDKKHYDYLKKALDEGQKGWIELDSAIPGGKLFVEIPNIAEMFLASAEYVENWEDRKRQSNLEG